jgi:hypothetical protein
MIDHISQCLRPGGLMELFEFDFRVYGSDRKPLPLTIGAMEPPWYPRWMLLLNMAVRQRGGSPDAANMLYSWTLQHPAFQDVVYDEYFLPTAPFMSGQGPNDDFLRSTSEILRDDILVCEQYSVSNCALTAHFILPGLPSIWSATSIRKWPPRVSCG